MTANKEATRFSRWNVSVVYINKDGKTIDVDVLLISLMFRSWFDMELEYLRNTDTAVDKIINNNGLYRWG